MQNAVNLESIARIMRREDFSTSLLYDFALWARQLDVAANELRELERKLIKTEELLKSAEQELSYKSKVEHRW